MPNCTLCGEPMPEGEEMFKYHGYSTPCPKPPLKRPKLEAIIEYFHRDQDGEFWLDIFANTEKWSSIAFDTAGERQRAHNDMLSMMRSVGATDLPKQPQ